MERKRFPLGSDPNPYRRRKAPYSHPQREDSSPLSSTEYRIDFNTQRICPSCAGIISITHNYCEFCGANLTEIPPIGNTNDIAKELALTAVNDLDPVVRREAVMSLTSLKERKALGVLTYILINDTSEVLRMQAAEGLGLINHPYSRTILKTALNDRSPLVREKVMEILRRN